MKPNFSRIRFRQAVSAAVPAAVFTALFLTAPWSVTAPQGEAEVLRIYIENLAMVDALSDAGFVVDEVADGQATVYLRPGERERFDALGLGHYVVETVKQAPQPGELGLYHTYDDLTQELADYANAFPDITRLFSLGTSVQGRELWALFISGNPDLEEDEPEFKYVSTMHGDEPVGTEMLLFLVDRILMDYGVEQRITELVDSTAIWIVPLMNPDGLTDISRFNANGVDLNRSFPSRTEILATFFDGAPLDAAGRQPETQAVMEWTVANSFALSANLHTGAVVVNYPYDDDGKPSGVDSPTPDDLLIEELSLVYSRQNPPMFNSLSFPNGITNGAEWFVITGGMQDWNYRYAGCIEVTLELSNIKRPQESTLPDFWDDNGESLLQYMESVHRGIRGVVTDRDTGEPLWARIQVDDNPQGVFTDPDVGDYYRLALPGTYPVKVSARDYIAQTVEDVQVLEGPATRLDVQLAHGDVDNDDDVDAADLQILVNAILGADCPQCDFDGNGVGATDLQSLVNTILRIF